MAGGPIALVLALVVGAGAWIPSDSAGAAPAGSLPTYTFVDLGTSFLPQAVSTSGVLTGGSPQSSSSFALQSWYGGNLTPLPMPTPPGGGTWLPSGAGFLNPSLLDATSLVEHGPGGVGSKVVPVVWQFGSDGTPSAPRIIEQTSGFTSSDSRGVVGVNYAGNVLIDSGAGGTYNTQITAPDAGAVSDVPSTGTPYTISATTLTADNISGTVRYQSVNIKDFTKRSTPPIPPVGVSDNGYLLGTVPNTFTEALIAPDGTSTVLPTNGAYSRVNDNGDVSGELAVLPHGASAATSIDSLIPASAGAVPGYSTITAMDDALDLVGFYSVLDGSTYVQHGFLLRAARSVTEPVVNSTGDAGVAQDGKLGCDTGQTVTIGGQTKPECTLRAAIQAENAGTVDANAITFALPSAAAIAPVTPLPALTAQGVTIDGTTGPGGTVTIDGLALPQGQSVVHVSGGSDVVAGIVPENATIGVLVDGSAGHDTVRASSFGVVAGATTGTGLFIGVKVSNSPSVTIGGTGTADRNVFGSVAIGVLVLGAGASGAVVRGNYFGTDASGNDIPVSAGVEIVDASGATVGGSTSTPGAAPGNVFDGLSQGGVNETGSAAVAVVGNAATVSGTTVAGNLIGFHADGVAPGSSHFADGVLVGGKLSGTTIGGLAAGSGNVIAGAAGAQILVSGTLASGTKVLGNLVGTDVTGTKIVGGGVGIAVHGAMNTTVGLPGAGRNVVAGGQYGILTSATSVPVTPGTAADPSTTPAPGTNNVTVTTAMNTAISGNIVGPGSNGTTVDPEQIMTTGVALAGIGETLGPNNQVAFTKTGVNVGNRSETVYGNLIGTDPNGTTALPNGVGVFVAAGKGVTGMLNGTVPTVKIGVAGQKPNVISGNTTNLMLGAPAQVQNNLIGTVANGKSAIGPYSGTVPESIAYGAGITGVLALLAAGSAHAIIGGTQPGMGNVISGGPPAAGSVQATGGLGVLASDIIVQGNDIGVGNDATTAVPNAGYGIRIGDGSTDVIGATSTDGKVAAGGGNVVANNGVGGIVVDAQVTAVSALSNKIHDNAGGGIVLADGTSNSGISTPSIVAAAQDADNTGAATDHTVILGAGSTPGAIVQVYAAANCPASVDDYTPGQGATLIASSTLGPKTIGGAFTIAVPVQPVGTKIVATSTDARGTSAFSSCATVAPAATGTNSKRATSSGSGQTAGGSGFAPGEPVTGSVHSTPIALGTKTANSNGSVQFTFTVPSSLERGSHFVLLTGTHSGASVAIPFSVYVAPTAPRSVHATVGKASAKITWLAPSDNGGSGVTAYRVYRSTGGTRWTLRATVHGRPYADTKLTGGTHYRYEITAVNAAGASPKSAAATATPYSAPSPPRSVHARAGSRSAAVRWSSPASAHGAAITAYVVEYASCTIGARGCTTHRLRTTAHSATVRHLRAGVRYQLAIVAVNKGGASMRSAKVFARPHR